MHVGVYLGDYIPEEGGGFTFQDDVFRSFISLAANQQHHVFTVLAQSAPHEYSRWNIALPGNVRISVLPRTSRLERGLERLRVSLPILRRIVRFQGPIERVARQQQIECIWHVAGGAAEATDIPYIATVWDLEHRRQPWFPEVSANGAWDARELAYNYFLKRASYVIVGTEAGRNEVHLFYQVPLFRIRILPHPTPQYALQGEGNEPDVVREKFGLPDRFLLYPAQFWSHKNHVNLIHAIKELRDSHGINLTLALVGSDKGNRAHVEKAIHDLDLNDQVRILGFVDQADLVGLYKAASTLVYASLCGPENLPPLEAFALGCPVAAADVPGAKEQLGDAALLFDPVSPTDIADKIAQLETDTSLRERLRRRAYARASRWAADSFVAEVFRMLDDFASIRRNWPA